MVGRKLCKRGMVGSSGGDIEDEYQDWKKYNFHFHSKSEVTKKTCQISDKIKSNDQ